MNNWGEVFARADLGQIRSFLLYGTEEYADRPCGYNERMARVEQPMTARLHRAFPRTEEYEEVTRFVWDYGSELEAVSMEVGLQLGAILAAQVCRNLLTASAGDTANHPTHSASGG